MQLAPEEKARLHAIATELDAARWHSIDRGLRVLPILLKGDPELFLRRLGGRDYEVDIAHGRYTDCFKATFTEVNQQSLSFNTQVVFFRLIGTVWLIVSIEPRFIYKHLVRQASRLFSLATVIFLSTRDLYRIFQDLLQEDSRIRVLQHSAYNSSESSIRFLKQERRPDQVFKELLSAKLVLRNISGAIRDQHNVRRIQFRISSNGSASYTLGSMAFLIEILMPCIARAAAEKNNLLSDRQRSKTNFRPVSLQFDADVLAQTSSNHHLVSVLSRIERMGVGVLHANPYVHLILTDFRDGSSFTLYSTSESRLQLVPSFRSSVSSISRIHRAIAEGFASCEIVDASFRKPKLSDFFELKPEDIELWQS